jgi:hypothetical protein
MSIRTPTGELKKEAVAEAVDEFFAGINAGLPMLSLSPGQLNNASGGAAAETGVIIDDPAAYQMPYASIDPVSWLDSLMGDKTIAGLYRIVSDGQVLSSPGGNAPLLTTLDSSVRSIAGRVWWQTWINYAIKDPSALMGGGMHNKAYKTPYVDWHFGGNANFSRLFGGLSPPSDFVIREGRPTEKRREIISEFVATAYCASSGIGPRVFAMHFWEPRDKPDPGTLGGGSLPPYPSMKAKSDFADAGNHGATPSKPMASRTHMLQPISLTYYVSEKWSGDCTKIIQALSGSNSSRVEPGEFCSVFVPLVKKAAEHGVFHGDLKRANLLYRRVGGAGGQLELTYTE